MDKDLQLNFKGKGKRSDAVVLQTPLNNRQCIVTVKVSEIESEISCVT